HRGRRAGQRQARPAPAVPPRLLRCLRARPRRPQHRGRLPPSRVMHRSAILAGYRGHIDSVEPVLSGWIAELARPKSPVAFVVAIDSTYRLAARADRPRPDVASAGLASPECGFAVALPRRFLDGAEHCLELLLPDGESLNLPGCPPNVALGAVEAH